MHDLNVHRKVSVKCTECFKEFSQKVLSSHMRSVHSTERYPCTECDFVSKTSLSLRLHFDAKHGDKKYICDQCSKAYGHPTSLSEHIINKHDGRIFNCETCDFRTENRDSLKSHQSAKHQILNVLHICPNCPFETPLSMSRGI